MEPVIELHQPDHRIHTEFAIPFGHAIWISNLRLLLDPLRNLLIACTASDEIFEFLRINPCEIEEHTVKRAVVVVGSRPVGQISPTFLTFWQPLDRRQAEHGHCAVRLASDQGQE